MGPYLLTAPLLVLLFSLAVISIAKNLLDVSGSILAFVIGSIILLFGGPSYLIVIFSFFILAIVATRIKRDYKRERSILFLETMRTWKNVFANGIVAMTFVVIERFFRLPIFVAGFLGAVSASTSDTLATEIGLLHPRNPRLITNFKEVPPGTSGAISPSGEISMALSALFIGIVAWLVGIGFWSLSSLILLVVVSGAVGCTFDSILGATVQATYKCRVCGKISEKPEHCGKEAIRLKGFRFIDNNVVNLASTIIGSAVAISLSLVL